VRRRRPSSSSLRCAARSDHIAKNVVGYDCMYLVDHHAHSELATGRLACYGCYGRTMSVAIMPHSDTNGRRDEGREARGPKRETLCMRPGALLYTHAPRNLSDEPHGC
jgi:hypothetical protein